MLGSPTKDILVGAGKKAVFGGAAWTIETSARDISMKQFKQSQNPEPSESVVKMERELTERFGPLLTAVHLAEVLHRSEQGLRWSLTQPGQFAETINATRIRIGRRNYYRAADLALLLTGEVAA